MKKLLLTLTAVTATALTTLGQGTVSFNNEGTFSTPDAITVGAIHTPGSGNTGDGIGGDKYAVQLVWVAGTGLGQSAFDAGVKNFSAVVTGVGAGGSANAAFLANTGPLATFSGFFDAGQVPSPVGTSMPAGGYTMQVLAWYKVGFADYNSAVAGGATAGKSALFNVGVTTIPVQSTVFSGFQVSASVIPEPSSLALAGLGALAMLVVRRKK
jgi:hypothetical protein